MAKGRKVQGGRILSQGTVYSTIKKLTLRASRVAQWLRVLYCSASCAIRVPGFAPRLCRDREVRGATHNWPSVARVREGLVGRGVLVSSRTSELGAVCANQGGQVHGVSSGALVH